MKLTRNEIYSILDDASQYIYDDLWSEITSEWVEDILSNITTNEYDNEDLNEILKELQDAQKEMQEEAFSEERDILYQAIEDFIVNYDETHLSLTDIGRVLVKLANNYLDE